MGIRDVVKSALRLGSANDDDGPVTVVKDVRHESGMHIRWALNFKTVHFITTRNSAVGSNAEKKTK